ncbi:MAG: alpha/beta hydrolase [Gemmatimonadota bacterium]
MIPDPLPFERAFLRWSEKAGVGWESLRVAGTHGYRLSPSREPKRTLVALHGAGNDALFGWVGLFKRLLLAETEILSFDIPGHGRRNDSRFSGDAALNAARSAISACARSRPDLPVHTFGVSLGGSVLLASLPDVQHAVTTAATVVAPLRIEFSWRAVVNEIGPRTLQLVIREREHYGLTGLLPSFGPFKRSAYPLRLAADAPPGSFGYIQALNEELESMHLEEAARRCTLPVMLVYGDADRVVPIAQGERLAGCIRRSRLCRIRGGTHLSTPLEPETTQGLLAWWGIS